MVAGFIPSLKEAVTVDDSGTVAPPAGWNAVTDGAAQHADEAIVKAPATKIPEEKFFMDLCNTLLLPLILALLLKSKLPLGDSSNIGARAGLNTGLR